MIEIHTISWNQDRAVHDGEEDPKNASLSFRAFQDGREIGRVMKASVDFSAGFEEITLTLVDQTHIVHHTQESWNALPPSVDW